MLNPFPRFPWYRHKLYMEEPIADGFPTFPAASVSPPQMRQRAAAKKRPRDLSSRGPKYAIRALATPLTRLASSPPISRGYEILYHPFGINKLPLSRDRAKSLSRLSESERSNPLNSDLSLRSPLGQQRSPGFNKKPPKLQKPRGFLFPVSRPGRSTNYKRCISISIYSLSVKNRKDSDSLEFVDFSFTDSHKSLTRQPFPSPIPQLHSG